ncbi:TonB-linked outer membrane protein, SusC/RagA family [Chitinophaga terrae (ex Kim and Jung 2007)]|uniref:TonB-linked outer membrane protein, SusC/RagA family n=1 Tax=Chitinophaga terrae (ex Kim and Jung 2007) TaxID=408074 RepID=A0A1H4EU45_9BACT|nr:TonB-dependent receptor [Chitinophaga terrae (ex Kim and Jung 2007)]SEA87742.1 TonB-linked outer membrane protein, SusC/RagA family [Chitinophaga terrae (ex Kim and Jung 2007)]
MKNFIARCSVVLFLCLPTIIVHAQQRKITGTVFDEQAKPLPGATVVVKETKTATVSDGDGKFVLSIPPSGKILLVSYVGMQTKEIPLGAQSDITVHMQLAPGNLNDVVVVGYGAVKKSDLTGAVATLKGSDLNRTPSSSVDQLLQGKIAGVQVTTGGGAPGAGATIRIRGASSLNGSKDPLVVVDGYPWGDAGNLKQINPEDIESIEVLKDASSAAIYGSRGANGVIVITTRKGKQGQHRISFNTLQTVSFLANKPDVWRDPVEDATFANEAAINGGAIATDVPYIGIYRPVGTGMVYFPSIAELRGLDPNKPKWPVNTDWVDLVYRHPYSQNYTLTADGGSDKTRYAISGNYYNEQGMVIKNGYEKYTSRLNLEQKLTNAITAGTNVILAYTKAYGQQLGVGRSRIWPVYDSTGNYFRNSNTDFGNPIALANQLLNKTKTTDVMGNLYVNFRINSWLQFRTSINAKSGNSIQDQYDPKNSTQRALDNKGSYGSISNGNYFDLLNENYFTITKDFGKRHKTNLVAGFSYQKTENRFSTLTGQNFVNDVMQNENLATASTMLISNSLQRFDLASWYGRGNYTFNDKYLLTITARADGSTKFGSNNKWAFFPSAALAWKAGEEQFIRNLGLFSELKVRASYGLTGNQGISPYQTLDRYGSNKYFTGAVFETGFGPGLAGANDEQGRTIVGGLGNNSLKWETTRSLDVGVDLGFLDQRLTLSADYYIKHTSDLLRLKTIAPSAGYDQQWINDGEIENRGIEIGLNANVINQANFTWSLGGMFTKNTNKVVSMGESNQVFIGTLYESVRQQISTYTVGQPMFSFYGYKTAGIIQTLDEGIKAGLTGVDAQPGEVKYLDLSGPGGKPDGIVDSYDRTIIGNPNPDFIYSLNTNLRYRQFDLSMQLYGVQGGQVWDFQKMTASRWLQRWTPDNPSTEYPRANGTRGWRASDFYLTDGSFLRIQNITLGYNLKTDAVKFVKSLRIYLSGNNLYTFTGFNKGFDPEVGENGINNGAYPRPRAVSLGANVVF